MATGSPASGSAPHEPLHHAILAVDIEGFGRRERTDQDRLGLRQSLYDLLDAGLAAAGIPAELVACCDRGDGVLLLAGAQVSTARLLRPLAGSLVEGLARHNDAAPRAARLRLRMVVHAGEVVRDRHGFAGDDLNLAFRLLDADVLRAILAAARRPLVLAVSEAVYRGVVRHGYLGIEPVAFHRVDVAVKETRTRAWVWVPGDHDAPTRARRGPPAPGPATTAVTRRKPRHTGELDLRAAQVLLRRGEHADAMALLAPTGEGCPGAVVASALPRRVDLIGRDDLVASIRERLTSSDPSPACLVWGAPGIGKTIIAIEVAHQLYGRFQGNVVWVDASHGSVPLLLDRIGEQLGDRAVLRARQVGTKADRVAQRLLECAPVLVVADDVRTRELLDHVMALGRSAPLLMTSPTGWDVPGKVHVPELAAADAGRLYLRLTGIQLSGDPGDPDVAELCRTLGHVPQAVVAWAYRVRRMRWDQHRSLGKLQPMRSAGGTAEPGSVHQSVWWPVTAALDALPPAARTLAGRLSAFDSDSIGELACEGLAGGAAAPLRALVASGVVEHAHAGRFRVNPANRWVIKGLVELARLRREVATKLARLVTERPELAATEAGLLSSAVHWAVRSGQLATAADLVSSSLDPLLRAGYRDRAREHAELVLGAVRPGSPLWDRVLPVRLGLARAERLHSDHRAAVSRLAAMLDEVGEPSSRARVLHELGLNAHAVGCHTYALRALQASLAAQPEDRALRAASHRRIGQVLRDGPGDCMEALRHSRLAEGLYRELGDWRGVARALHDTGRVIHALGDSRSDARVLLERSLQVLDARVSPPDPRWAGHSLLWLGVLDHETGHLAGAASRYDQAARSYQQAGDDRGRLLTAYHRGRLALDARGLAGAWHHARECLELSTRLLTPRCIRDALALLADVARAQRQDADAAAYLAAARTVSDRCRLASGPHPPDATTGPPAASLPGAVAGLVDLTDLLDLLDDVMARRPRASDFPAL